MGRNFKDANSQRKKFKWPFSVIEEDGKVKIPVDYKGNTECIFPEEVAAAILGKLKKIVEDKLKIFGWDVVISIPAYFNDAQRQATLDAAAIAGFKNTVHLVHEPTAAALAFGLNRRGNEPKTTVLVYDLGGGTFDVSVLEINGNDYTVKAVNGDTELGGEEFDKNMVDFFVEHFIEEYNRDISNEPILMADLKIQCEKSKRLLSTQTIVELVLPGTELKGSISRAKFNRLNQALFQRTIDLVEELFKNKELKLKKSEIDEVLLVGGSSRIPKIQEMLKTCFDEKELNKSVNPDEVVALGAAIRAAKILNLTDVCPLSLSTDIKDGSVSVVIPQNTQIPTKMTKTFQTCGDNQKSVYVAIYEGERKMAEDNHFLGHFTIYDLPEKPRGEVKIELTFEIDENGILTVTGVEPTTGKTNNIVISNTSRLSKHDADKLIRAAARHIKDDEAHKQRLVVRNKLEDAVYDKLDHVENDKNLDFNRKKKAIGLLQGYLDWIKSNSKAEKHKFEQKLQDLENGLPATSN